ncbi:MAG: hypothetical protein WBD27_09165 [Pyrinomonadaceae bacterium]
MINEKDNPVEWAILIYELDDAREHLETLLKEMSEAGDFTDEDFAASVGHIFAHLNRAWNTRNVVSEITSERTDAMSQFPTDLKPVG